jgi:hypothetical protein
VVLAEQPGQDRAALYAGVLGQDRAQVSLSVDEQVIQAFAAQHAYEPFGVGVGLR